MQAVEVHAANITASGDHRRAPNTTAAPSLRPLRAIPVVLLGTLTYAIGNLYAALGAVVILFTGQLPPSFAEPLRDAAAAVTRVCAYIMLMQDDPPALRAGD